MDVDVIKALNHNAKLEMELLPIFEDAVQSADAAGIVSLLSHIKDYDLRTTHLLHTAMYNIETENRKKEYDFDLNKYKGQLDDILSRLIKI